MTITLLLAAGVLAGALFSAAGAAPLVSPPVPLFFSCAHKGNARSAPIASAAHQFRMSFLPKILLKMPFDSHTHSRNIRFLQRAPFEAARLCPLPRHLHRYYPSNGSIHLNGENGRSHHPRFDKVIPQFAPGATISSFGPWLVTLLCFSLPVA
jgi:hypothetical protein